MVRVAFFLCVGILSLALGDRIFVSISKLDAQDFPDGERILPNGHAMVVTNGTDYLGMYEMEEIPTKNEVFLVKLSEDLQLHVAQIKETGAEFLHLFEGFAFISVRDPKSLDSIEIPTPKEHIIYVPEFESSPKAFQLPSDSKSNAVNAIDWDEIVLKVKQLSGATGFTLNNKLVTTPTRYTYSTAIALSASFAKNIFLGLGYDGSLQNYTISGNAAFNVIGIKKGKVFPNEIIVVGAHYDSTSQKPTSLAPGANDDGSGSAGVLHLAEIFAEFDTDRTIHFVLFSGEEQGLYGSQNYVKVAQQSKLKIVSAICMDMIGYSKKYFGVTIEGLSKFQSLVDLVAKNVVENANDKKFQHKISLSSFGSDHVSFQNAGIPALLLIEMDDTSTPYYHTTTDTWDTLNGPQTVQILRSVAGSLCDLAGC